MCYSLPNRVHALLACVTSLPVLGRESPITTHRPKEALMICYACQAEQPLTEFHKNPHNSDGYNHTCKTCCQAYHRDYITRPKTPPDSGMITCSACKESKPLSEFYAAKGTKTGYATQCKLCSKSAARKWRASNRERPFIDMVLSGNILCPRCNTEKDVSEFSHNKTNLSGYSDWCRACSKIYLAEYSANNKEKISAHRGTRRT